MRLRIALTFFYFRICIYLYSRLNKYVQMQLLFYYYIQLYHHSWKHSLHRLVSYILPCLSFPMNAEQNN